MPRKQAKQSTVRFTMHLSRADVDPKAEHGALCGGSVQVIYAAYRKVSTCDRCKELAEQAGLE